MSKTKIMETVSTAFNKLAFKTKKYSPEILIAVGVVTAIAGTVSACRATTKIGAVLDDAKKQIETIHNHNNIPELVAANYTEEDAKKDLTIVYAKTGLKIVKMYLPAIGLGILSFSSVIGSHNILRKRNAALVAAYTAIDTGFKKYRKRVVDRFGETVDKELRYGVKATEITEKTVDPKTGKEVEKTKTVDTVDPNEISDYARFFDESCSGWDKNAEYNLMFLKTQQAHANDILKSRGYLFLNEVYDMLGIQRTKAGQVVGWLYDKDNPNYDNYVDFGIYDDLQNERRRAFVNGYERNILLDFNVNGPILDSLD